MRCGWVLGWSVARDWFAAEAGRAWPGAEHRLIDAAPDWRERLEALGPLDLVGGYSLGTLLLLREREWIAARWPRVVLLAPIWGFPAESRRGGRVPGAKLRLLGRWLSHDPGLARSEFGAFAGLPPEALESGASAETLAWGLAQLGSVVAGPGLPDGWFAVGGAADALCDPEWLAREEPAVRWIPGAGHAPAPLLRGAAAGMAG